MAEMATIHHKLGTDGFLASDAPGGRFRAVFEDDGTTGYFYGLDKTREERDENPIVDALHIYDAARVVDQEARYPIEIRWAANGNRVGLFIEDKCHAVFDFDERRAVCRSGFPPGTGEFTSSHDWDEALAVGF